ncbi:hypothetical protein CIHG_05569 [Coccidioides immitis H538.4]|uniref:Uncharacterized protein n=1 Tax=Coccidioides immitis H538.4 TaxID=396776 RepID=A0A0J8RT99_COCIT|nr:hypothetical protein CIHG_05569 [Coccidioides immitis H538.4]
MHPVILGLSVTYHGSSGDIPKYAQEMQSAEEEEHDKATLQASLKHG